MPWSYTINPKQGVVFTVASGVVTDEDIMAHQKALRTDPDFRPDMRQLIDFSPTTELKVTTQGIKQAVAGNPWGAGSRRALVAPNETIYGMARMFELGRVDPQDEFCVFRTMAEAREWLGLGATQA